MPSFTRTIEDEVGLHARPAAMFVRAAGGFASSIKVARDDRSADAKSLLEVLQLEAGKGAVITVSADGPDADEALVALAAILDAH
jgi:phosphotransferase system HPr (HPr) family protein